MLMMMMTKEQRDVRPLLVKFGVALALSFAGFLYARLRTKRIKPSNPPPNPDSSKKVDNGGRSRINDDIQLDIDSTDSCDKPCIRVRATTPSIPTSPNNGNYPGGDKDEFLLPEFDQLVNDLNSTTTPPSKTIYSLQKDDYEHEIENLKRRVRYLRERERKLEVQLLEYYGLKEQEKAMMELQNRVKINNMEAKLFSMRIESLEAENKRLAAQVGDYSKVVSELEESRTKIKMLKWKIRYEAQQNKEQILELTQRVTRLGDQEHDQSCTTSGSEGVGVGVYESELEREASELRKLNEKLQQEIADLGRRLEATQLLANSVLDDPEKEELNKELQNLREENKKLTTDVERLQLDRCADAEELVYLRWINACLRYELRNYQPPPGKTVARDLSKCLSPTSEKKAKQLILEYANSEDGGDQKDPSVLGDFDFDTWPSSQPSYLTDSTEHDDSSPRHTSDNTKHKKFKIFTKLRRLIMGKHGSSHHSTNHNPNNSVHSGRVSPIYRSFSVDDIGRRRCSSESPRDNHSCYDNGPDASPSNKLASSSQNSNHSSADFQPLLSRLDEEDSKDFDQKSNASDSRLENDPKNELVKYAEALRDSRASPRTRHKKSASYSIG